MRLSTLKMEEIIQVRLPRSRLGSDLNSPGRCWPPWAYLCPRSCEIGFTTKLESTAINGLGKGRVAWFLRRNGGPGFMIKQKMLRFGANPDGSGDCFVSCSCTPDF